MKTKPQHWPDSHDKGRIPSMSPKGYQYTGQKKGIKPNLSLITRRKGKSSSSCCKMAPKDRLKCQDAFRGRQWPLPSHIHSPQWLCPCCSPRRLSSQRRQKNCLTKHKILCSIICLDKNEPWSLELYSSKKKKKKKPRVKTKFLFPLR